MEWREVEMGEVFPLPLMFLHYPALLPNNPCFWKHVISLQNFLDFLKFLLLALLVFTAMAGLVVCGFTLK